MTWQSNSRRMPKHWRTLRRFILERDEYECQIAGPLCWGFASEVDHIVPGDNNDPANLRAVCHHCHGKKTAQEGCQARKAKKARAPSGCKK